MFTSWPICKLFNISIRIDSSWIIIFGLLTWALGGYYFPLRYPSWPEWQYWAIGISGSILLFVSVLIHELTHSLVARKRREEVSSITLFFFGGVAEIDREPETPAKEFVIALAGPLASIVISIFFMGLWLVFQKISEPIGSLTKYLFIMNLILAIFNLVPGFPLDGGRILRAVAWKITKNLRRATKIASTTGQVIAFFLILLGISEIVMGFFFTGLWIALIGWFIHSAAVRGYRQVFFKELLKDVRVKDLMDTNFATVDGALCVQDLVENFILGGRERSFLVTQGGKLAGIVCLENIKSVPPEKRKETTVWDIMTPENELEALTWEDDASEALARLVSGKIQQLPVLEGDQIKGIICRSNILDFLHLHSELGV